MADVKEDAQVQLNQTAHIVLGMLSYGYPLSGYEIRQWANRSLHAFYKAPAQSQIYRELAKLEDHRLVTSKPIAQDDNPDKIVFELTAAGRDALQRWIESGATSEMVIKHPLAVQTSFAMGHDSTQLVDRIQAHIDQTLSTLHELEDLQSGLSGNESSALAQASISWAMKIRQADIAGANAAIEALNAARP